MTKELKDRINKRKIAYVYLMHRMFGGSPVAMRRTLGLSSVTVADLQDWDSDYRTAVFQTIEEEDAHGVKMPDPYHDVPSIKSIKEKVLRRCDVLINTTEDPARLATVYKILSEFEVSDDKKEKSVLDAINESIKPLRKTKGGTVSMLDKIREQNRKGDPDGRGPGRPRKEETAEEEDMEDEAALPGDGAEEEESLDE